MAAGVSPMFGNFQDVNWKVKDIFQGMLKYVCENFCCKNLGVLLNIFKLGLHFHFEEEQFLVAYACINVSFT